LTTARLTTARTIEPGMLSRGPTTKWMAWS